MLEIAHEDIERLTDHQLTDLLRRLLHLEAARYGIPGSSAHVSLRITVADGGEDGNINWDGPPDNTDFLPQRLVGFQCKAVREYPPGKAAEELIREGEVKRRIHDVLNAGGAHILFISLPLNRDQIEERIARMRERLGEVGAGYASTAVLRIYDANRIRDWTNRYASAVLYVCGAVGKRTILGAKTWDEWASLPDMRSLQYQSTSELTAKITQIRSAIAEPGTAIRVVGLSTVGKTRLVFEAFRPEGDVSDATYPSIAYRVAYADAEGAESLAQELSDVQRTQPFGVLVVDNCPLDLHKRIAKEVKRAGSQLSLVTIDLNPAEEFSADPVIRLEPLDLDTILALLKQRYGSVPDEELTRLASFAQGFPEFAVRLVQARLENQPDFGRINDDEAVSRLLWGREMPQPAAEKVISALALFEQVGLDGPVEGELEHVAEAICGMNPADFHAQMMRFHGNGLVEKRGHFVRVRLPPLAVTLAARWWHSTRPVDARRIIDELPERLAEAMCERMTLLDFLQPAKELVADLCGEQGSFGRAEALNTERGSRLFRAFVEVNPEATAATLLREFGFKSRVQLLELSPGRRHLVWALEKLAFRRETFNAAATVLLRFAGAENEEWSNNATGIFCRLFHVRLSGTEAEPEQRLTVIDVALKSAEPRERGLGVEAIRHVLEARHFTRTRGAERQGSGPPLNDWAPKYWKEMFDYWQAALRRLMAVMSNSPELAERARDVLAEQLGGLLLSDEMIYPLDQAVRKAAATAQGYWPKGYAAVGNAIRYRSADLPDRAKAILNEWRELLGPRNLGPKDRLRLIVSIPGWSQLEKDASGNITNIAEKAAAEFAKECASDFDRWLPEMRVLFHGEQRQGFAFGAQLGNEVCDPEPFIRMALEELCSESEKGPNSMVLCGFLNTLQARNPKLVESTLDETGRVACLWPFVVPLTHSVLMSPRDLTRVSQLVRSGAIPANSTRSLSYGRALDHLDVATVTTFALAIAESGEAGAWSALEIVFMYAYGTAGRWEQIKSAMRTLVMHPELHLVHESATTDRHHWQEAAAKLLTEEDDSELAAHVAVRIVDACKAGASRYDIPEDVLKPLLSKYLNTAWPIFASALLEGGTAGFQLVQLLGVSPGDKASGSLMFEVVPTDFLINWVDREARAPEVLAQMTPIYASKGEQVEWHPVAQHLIDNHGDEPKVLSGLSSNLGSFGWTGSLVPYYQRQLTLFRALEQHRLASVRAWANKSVGWLQKQIDQEQKEDEDGEMGVFY